MKRINMMALMAVMLVSGPVWAAAQDGRDREIASMRQSISALESQVNQLGRQLQAARARIGQLEAALAASEKAAQAARESEKKLRETLESRRQQYGLADFPMTSDLAAAIVGKQFAAAMAPAGTMPSAEGEGRVVVVWVQPASGPIGSVSLDSRRQFYQVRCRMVTDSGKAPSVDERTAAMVAGTILGVEIAPNAQLDRYKKGTLFTVNLSSLPAPTSRPPVGGQP